MIEETTMKKKKHPALLMLLVFASVIIITAIVIVIGDKTSMKNVASHEESGDWEVVSTQSYVRDGQKCMGYRIYVDYDYASTDIYKDIFLYVTDDDGYYLHTVWIYNIKFRANGSYSADYIMEQTRQGELPTPVRQ